MDSRILSAKLSVFLRFDWALWTEHHNEQNFRFAFRSFFPHRGQFPAFLRFVVRFSSMRMARLSPKHAASYIDRITLLS